MIITVFKVNRQTDKFTNIFNFATRFVVFRLNQEGFRLFRLFRTIPFLYRPKVDVSDGKSAKYCKIPMMKLPAVFIHDVPLLPQVPHLLYSLTMSKYQYF